MRSAWDHFRSSVREVLVPPTDGPHAVEIEALTQQFWRTLRASFLRVPEPPASATERTRVYAHAKELVERGARQPSWNNNYELEQLLVDLYDAPTLEQELEVRVREAELVLRPRLAQWYAQRAQAVAQSEPGQRALLGRLVNDLQWRYMSREVGRGFTQAITADTAIAFLGTLVLFALLLVVVIAHASKPDSTATWPIVSLVAVTGAWGASFSMLIGLRNRLAESSIDDLKLLARRVVQASRILVGLGASLVLLILLSSGIVAGELFPALAAATSTQATSLQASRPFAFPGGGDLALLLFWCFLAGFSERLVPALLGRAEAQVASEPPSRNDAGAARGADEQGGA